MSRYTRNEDGTVTDSKTGLTWSKTLLNGERVSHAKATEAVAELGEGFRKPTTDELLTLVDRSRRSPATDTEAFPDTENNWYWTDDECAWNDAAVWVVYFNYGLVNYNHRNNYACVRAVRSSQ